MQQSSPRDYLTVCLNPVIQKTLVYENLAKGEVNRTSNSRIDASGKGINVARVLTQSGREAIHLTQLGGPTRDWFLALCSADGVRVSWVESGSEIRFCTTLIDGADGTATELVEEAKPVQAGTELRIHDEFDRLLPAVRAVILSGTKAAGLSPRTMSELAKSAAAAGKSLILDIKGDDLASCLPFRPLVAKPNLEELLQTYAPDEIGAFRSGELDNDRIVGFVSDIGSDYWRKYGSHLVVTRGAKATLYWDGSGLREYQGPIVKALNPIGSGDSFTAGLAASLVEGAAIAEAVAEGARLGALNAERLKPGSIS
jgi:1-phosphofructokinase/tagatose 6-phosphate kinase